MKNKPTIIILALFLSTISYIAIGQTPIYKDPNQPIEARAKDLVSKMTLEEKVLQMMHTAPAIPRLDLPAYNWWNEALHGVGRSGSATVFPQAIGLGATFDSDLALRVSTVISDEARAMYNAAIAKGYHQKYGGLTFWTPNVNIFRDPRWGRGQETYGEDPFLTSTLGVAFVKGLQGEDPKYLKTAACAKHYAVHSGPERLRHEFNAVASKKDMFETYLPAFHALVDADVEAVMCAYNATNGEPCCSNKYLLQDLLRKEWGFDGHVVSDCWAVVDFYEGHKNVKNVTEASALAVNSGVNLNCGDEYPALVDAVKQGLISEETINNTLAHLLETRFKLGMFDPEENVPYNNISPEIINSKKHRALAKEVATKSIVMLKNNGVLPLKSDLSTYYVTGPNAANVESLVGNYYGVNPEMVTVLEGITKAIEPGSQLQYRPGVLLDRENVNPIDWSSSVAAKSDATFMVMGINGLIEGEEGESIASEHYGDRLDYNVPKNQIDYLRKLKDSNDNPVIAIVTGGSPMNLAEVQEIADAVLLVWYPGEEGGNAVADIIFGKTSPSGRLPITFPKSLDQLPNYQNYDMEGRTYRYMKEEPLYPFGYGLSYTTFNYSDIQLSTTTARRKKMEPITVSALVKNTGEFEAEEVVQFYITDKEGSARTPLYSLKGIKRVKLKPGASERVSFSITEDILSLVDNEGRSILEKGEFDVFIGGSLPDKRSSDLGMPAVAKTTLTLK
ncbi:glycoside hydrolase family 3 C-terminal domain-containing protein [Fulvivirga maritima]|uniref:glycoside hydrolase family 3 N-terminal domain-containing protein n=1 Tax=Fulvivirga maritima TaxID=2904247 RepID=UPI001F24CFE6|nr:glycoside hydrolase family 3 N-terminal domain-containing protein [Fulvivirga maritima]UII27371.1 glycoside hydrolase family 3 C-terminal domain-containing protein [Fulvivirga maritima]